MNIKVVKINIKFFLFALLIITACSRDSLLDPPLPSDDTRGSIVNITLLGSYTPQQISTILYAAGISFPVALTYSVRHIKIVYKTIDADGNYIEVSGAIMLPAGANNLPVVSLLHGTVTKKDQVASVSATSSFEGVEGLVMASLGYAVSLPDYPGLGVSAVLHPYVHAKSLADASIDCIRASKNYCSANNIMLNGQLFITGYSEGGYAAMALHKEIETNYSNEFTITASAPMAGPYDMTNTAKTILGYSSYSNPAYIAYIMLAYNTIYKWNDLDGIFKSPYDQTILELFNGTKTLDEINNQLPNRADSLLQQSFINGVINGTDTRTLAALSENDLVYWVPQAPMRLYHGNRDEQVPYTNSVTAAANFTANGAKDVQLVTTPGGTHLSSAVGSVTAMIDWFETKKNKVNKIIAIK